LAVKGSLSNILLNGTSPFVLTLSAAQVSANSDALLRIGSTYSITLSDAGTPTITLRNTQITSNITTLLSRITSAHSLVVDGPIRPVRAANLADGGATIVNRIAAGGISLRDYPGNMRTYLPQLLTLTNAGKIASIDTRGGRPFLNLTAAEVTTYAPVLALITTPYTLTQIIAVADIGTATLAPGFTTFSVHDTVANVMAALPQIQALWNNDRLGRVVYTDTAPRIVTDAATLMANPGVFAAQDNDVYPVVLTDAGTPAITLPAHIVADFEIRHTLLNAISGPWTLQITGHATAGLMAVIAEEDTKILERLTGTVAVAAYSFDLQFYLAQLEVVARTGKIANIDLLDSAMPVLSMSQSQVSTYATVLNEISGAYILQTPDTAITRVTTASLAQIAIADFGPAKAIALRDMVFAPANRSFNFSGTTLQVLENGVPLGTAAVTPAAGTSYDSKSFYFAPDGAGGTAIKVTPAPLAVANTTLGTNFVTGGDFYAGTIGYLQRQFINPTGNSVNIAANIPNVFLHGGGVVGLNALQVLSGSNVLDGGVGSNFLVGGSNPADRDTFFLDARGGQVSWGTVVNFHQGDAVTFWGWKKGTTTYDWVANDGVGLFKGATIHARINGGEGAYNASITFAGVDLATAQKSFTLQETAADVTNPYMYITSS